VIRVMSGVRHCYQQQATSARVEEIGVKVFKTTADARRESQKVLPFHRRDVHRLPGLPNDRIQRSLDAGIRRDRLGEERAFIIQEWVDGESLENLIRRYWPAEPSDGTLARSILEQLLGGIVIPLWGVGTVWWDVRDANYCYSARSGRLKLIDLDSLAAYADEILETPQVWTRRDKGRVTALARLRRLSVRLLLGQGLRNKKRIETSLTQAWENELEPTLYRLGKEREQKLLPVDALERFFHQLDERHCFRYPETNSAQKNLDIS
jgi:hypothetical protein